MASNTVPAAVPGPHDPPPPTIPAPAAGAGVQQPGGLAGLLAPVQPTRSATAAFSLHPQPADGAATDPSAVTNVSSDAYRDADETPQNAAGKPAGGKPQTGIVRAWMLAGAERWKKGADARNKRLDIKKARAQARQVKETVTVNRTESTGGGSANSHTGPKNGGGGKSLTSKTTGSQAGKGGGTSPKNSTGATNSTGGGKPGGSGNGSGAGPRGKSGGQHGSTGRDSSGTGSRHSGASGRSDTGSAKVPGPRGKDHGGPGKQPTRKTGGGTAPATDPKKPTGGGTSGSGRSGAAAGKTGSSGVQGPAGKPGKDANPPKPAAGSDGTNDTAGKKTSLTKGPDTAKNTPGKAGTDKTSRKDGKQTAPDRPADGETQRKDRTEPAPQGAGDPKTKQTTPDTPDTQATKGDKDTATGSKNRTDGKQTTPKTPAPRIDLTESRTAGYRDGTRAAKAVAHTQAWRDGARDGYRDTTEAATREKTRLDQAHAARKNTRTHPEQDRPVTQPASSADYQPATPPVPPMPGHAPGPQPVQVNSIDATHLHLADSAARPHIRRGEVRRLRDFQQLLTLKSTNMTGISEATRALEHHALEQAKQVTQLLEQARGIEGGENLVAALTRLQENAQNQVGKAAEIHKRAVRAADACQALHANTETRYGPLYQAVVDSPETSPAEMRYYREMETTSV